MRPKIASALLVALLVASAPRPAGAIVLSEDVFAERSTEVGAIIRSFLFALFGDILAPPFNPVEDADPTATGIFDFRLYFKRKAPSYNIVVHNQLTATVRSHGSLGPVGLGRGVEPPRLLPLTFEASDQATLRLASTVDWAYASVTRGRLTLTVGRQPVTFGRGKLWKPTDLIGTFALTEVDTEYKPGADAVRVDWSSGDRITVTAVAATGELEQDETDVEATVQGTAAMARAAYGLSKGEVAGVAGFIRGDVMAGADAVWDTGDFELYGEATATLVTGESLIGPGSESGDVVGKGVVGATFHWTDVTISPELLWNGFGSFDDDDYLDLAVSDRVAIGEQTTLGRFYAAGVGSWQAHPLLQVSGALLVNPVDPSGLASLVLTYNAADNVVAGIGGYLPVGRKPTVAPPSARSEYGLYPYFLFAHVKAVM